MQRFIIESKFNGWSTVTYSMTSYTPITHLYFTTEYSYLLSLRLFTLDPQSIVSTRFTFPSEKIILQSKVEECVHTYKTSSVAKKAYKQDQLQLYSSDISKSFSHTWIFVTYTVALPHDLLLEYQWQRRKRSSPIVALKHIKKNHISIILYEGIFYLGV